jgi:ankyrin repeat protein
MAYALEIRTGIASRIPNRKDLVALGGTDCAWREAVDVVCRSRLKKMFGEEFVGNDSAVTQFAEIWAPLAPKTHQLTRIFPLDRSLPVSDKMEAIFKVVREGTVEELKGAIQSLDDPSELTELKFGGDHYCGNPNNPLLLAVKTKSMAKLQLLIEAGTPIGVGNKGMIPRFSPLCEASLNSQDAMVQLLLENGASFKVIEDARIGNHKELFSYSPIPLLYRIFESIIDRNTRGVIYKTSNAQLRCFMLAMRSWKYEVGSRAIRKDVRLKKFAGMFCLFEKKIANLLLGYGVVPKVDKKQLFNFIKLLLVEGDIEQLEYLRGLRLFSYNVLFVGGFSIPDYLITRGKFALEKYFIEKGLLHNNKKKALEQLEENISRIISEETSLGWQAEMSITGPEIWNWVLEASSHYNIAIDKLKHEGIPILLDVCKAVPHYYQWKNPESKYYITYILGLIEKLVESGCDLDCDVEELSPRVILEQLAARHVQNLEITQKINSILNRKKDG